MIIYFILTSLLFFTSSLTALPPVSPLLPRAAEEKTIVVYNRILAKVHNKALSVIDLQKKMDVIFYQRFPEYADSASIRYQFYQVNWMPILEDLIDKELVLADAREAKIEVSRGDVRQELESLFGPNVIANLAKVGLSFEEAWNMVEGDILIRRMMMLRVNFNAQQRVSPKAVRKKYEEFSAQNRKAAQWTYQLISVRHPDKKQSAETARVLQGQLASRAISMQELAKSYSSFDSIDDKTNVTFSAEYTQNEQEISAHYQDILHKMQPDTFSNPVAQKSRKNKGVVHRIFYLKSKEPGGVIPFREVEAKLQAQLTSEAIAEETSNYLQRLRERANVTKKQIKKNLPDHFEPFQLA